VTILNILIDCVCKIVSNRQPKHFNGDELTV